MVTSRMQVSCALVQLFPAIFLGSGIDWGAVKMTVELAEFAGILPVSEVHAVAVPVCCFPLLSKVNVAYVQLQVTFVLVLPVTVAVSVSA